MTEITSLSNPMIKAAVRLRQRRERDTTGTFLIEGAVEVARAAAADVTVETLFVTEPTNLPANNTVTVSHTVMDKLAIRGTNAGVVAIARAYDISLATLPPAIDLVLIAEGIEKPGNLGTMIRTADAAGAAVVVCDPLVDVFNPQVIRSSLGCLFTIPVAQASLAECLEWATGFHTIVATPESADTLYRVDLTGPTAIVIGTEHAGVSDTWKQSATTTCSIPMAGSVDSLNAATSAAVMLYEAIRQRTTGEPTPNP